MIQINLENCILVIQIVFGKQYENNSDSFLKEQYPVNDSILSDTAFLIPYR